MDLQLAGRRAVVTGGSKGIGKAIAAALAHEGCDVGLVARGQPELAAAADELQRSSGRTIVALPADTGSDESVERMARQARDNWAMSGSSSTPPRRPVRGCHSSQSGSST
jgi:short-subunit dehydrogenase